MGSPSHLRIVDAETTPAVPLPSLDAIFRTYSPYVAAIGLRLLGRVEEIEDLIQDVFVSAHRGLAALREPAALKGWLATVTVRVARRRLRARRIRALLRFGHEYDYQILAPTALAPDDRAALVQVYELLDRLPVAERLAWTLRHLEGERLERIAELTGASLATVKRRVAAANLKLRGTDVPADG